MTNPFAPLHRLSRMTASWPDSAQARYENAWGPTRLEPPSSSMTVNLVRLAARRAPFIGLAAVVVLVAMYQVKRKNRRRLSLGS